MKKHLPSAAVLLSLLLVLCMYAFTSDRDTSGSGSNTPAASHMGYVFSPIQGEAYQDFSQVMHPISSGNTADALRTYPDFVVNGVSIGRETAWAVMGDTVYVAVAPVIRALYPALECSFDEATRIYRASAEGMDFVGMEWSGYFCVNGRFFYVPHGNMLQGTELLVPLSTLAEALGCTVTLRDPEIYLIRRVGPAASANTYDEEDLYWLSRIIFAEAGNQPMAGRVAVGTVILNRVVSERFPNTVKEVIFEPNQFSPVNNGMIYRDPDYDSTVAAMLCLDGVKEAGDSLYFNVNRLNSWANRTKTYVATIGDHTFFM